MKNVNSTPKRNFISRFLGTIAVGGTIVASSMIGSAAHAACDLRQSADLSGQYIPAELLGKSNGSTSLVTITKKGCTLEMKATNVDTMYDYSGGKMTSKLVRSSGGVWKFDLSGKNKAVVPGEYIRANDINPETRKMTKSLEIFSTLNSDDSITFRAYFDVERVGAVVRMSIEARLHFFAGNVYVDTSGTGKGSTLFSGAVSMGETKISVVPSRGLSDNAAARNLVIAHGANWLLEAFREDLDGLLGKHRFSFYRK